MVVRLFIPPGEGQHHIVPKRPEPLPANATLYVIVASTALAAANVPIFAAVARRAVPDFRIARTAYFIRSVAVLGPCAAAAGAFTNIHYHRGFTSIVVAETVKDPAPAKLWEKTERYTVEDGCIAGAAAGMLAFLPTLFMRRVRTSWTTRLLGMTNIGASVGIVTSEAYFQYTGERQKALKELERQRRRRSLEFHHIFWNKLLMAKFDPMIQQYVRHNGIFRAYHLPAEVYEAPDKYGIASKPTAEKGESITASATATENDGRFYKVAKDHLENLEALDVEGTKRDVEACRQERQMLLKEAEYMYHELTRRQHLFCTTVHTCEDDKQRQLRELQLLSIAYNRIRTKAEELDRSVLYGTAWLQQKTAMDSNGPPSAWLSRTTLCDPESHDPAVSIAEMQKFQEQFEGEIKQWEALVKSRAPADLENREKYKRDLDDARLMLRAADQVVYEMELKKGGEKGAVEKGVKVGGHAEKGVVEKGVKVGLIADKRGGEKGPKAERNADKRGSEEPGKS
ncbi:hypothetical protein K458DRAFT_423120 [Lentithecium fluviatile CBS 122367]|uniref:Uncharacterized protein n=1 Tax=Lentithecium fluviatile CBS 122367 TaxID=1168545 RepID=A0A6G1IKE9_9PLEO|nr:hypothetical protein K458DRAFT_423120 [Lentithecium fluviatile CBS 122367]